MSFRPPLLPVLLVLTLILLAKPAYAFGAGNIASASKIEGSNWRHGDIEDTLLTLLTARAVGGKFSKIDVKRIYFGNWLRDYSQAVDVGTVKNVSAEAIRLLLWILGFMSFGYGTAEFEVTADRLGCYRPEEHIDNPKDYADNVDARQYDPRLRGPVDEARELSVDPRTGLKQYIASEDVGITTSAGLVRKLLRRSIELGRQYAHTKNDADYHEALRLLGTATHCMEDFSAHSNYCELALIELGETNVFPHVGRRTQMQLPGVRQPVYPIVTGTFGGVDFLHSVLGEVSDKATQSEVQELEGTIQQSKNSKSILKTLLAQIPSGLLGGSNVAGKADQLEANAQAAQLENMKISPKQPEAFTVQADQLSKQLLPIMEFHDSIMKSISETIEKIPVLPSLIEQVQDQINMFVFSLIAQFILPIINQVKTELQTGSSEVIQSSKDKQLIVFHDDNSTDPTHSVLSKDHFSNILNDPAGRVASQVLKWVVPQVVACWDDESIDIKRTNDRIIHGVFHHPALREGGEDGARDGRQGMFAVVEQWWRSMSEHDRTDLRHKLSREGVMTGKNHKEGVHDSGHGCGKPLGMPTAHTAASSGAIGGFPISSVLGGLSSAAAAGVIGDDMFGGGHEAPHNSSGPHQGPNQAYGQHAPQSHLQGPGGRGGMRGRGGMHGQGRHDDDDDSDNSHESDDDETRQNRRQRRQERMQARQGRKEDRQERREERMERREERMEHRRPSASPQRRHSPEGGMGRGGRGRGMGRGGGGMGEHGGMGRGGGGMGEHRGMGRGGGGMGEHRGMGRGGGMGGRGGGRGRGGGHRGGRG